MSVRNMIVWSSVTQPDFLEVYETEHVPLIRALPQLQRMRVSPLASRSGGLVAELSFADVDTMRAAYASEAGVELIAHASQLESTSAAEVSTFVLLEPDIDESLA